jgi:DNA replication and repair protein RecF
VIVRGIELTNFRNITRAGLSFSPAMNVFTGRNAQGKTNLLEAIHLFSLGRSFRTRSLEEAIRFGEEYFFCRLAGRSDAGVDFSLDIGLERAGRLKVSVNGTKAAGIGEIIGVIPSVIFVAEDILIATGPPVNRRSYLDYTAAQISPAFLQDIREYRRIVRQRNALLETALRAGREPDGLEAWDEALVARAAAIVRMRTEVLGDLARTAGALLNDAMGVPAGLEMTYVCSFNPGGKEPAPALREALARAREAERRRGYTMAGPHYDDVAISVEGTELRRYGSQGRKRLAALVLKLAQALTIMDRRGERPVVLLDDIFSELDRETVERVRGRLTESYQSFITSPRPDDLALEHGGAAFFRVQAGEFFVSF